LVDSGQVWRQVFPDFCSPVCFYFGLADWRRVFPGFCFAVVCFPGFYFVVACFAVACHFGLIGCLFGFSFCFCSFSCSILFFEVSPIALYSQPFSILPPELIHPICPLPISYDFACAQFSRPLF
jgi:hypothetical protein